MTVILVGSWYSKEGVDLDNANKKKARFEEANPDVVIQPDLWTFDRKAFYAKAASDFQANYQKNRRTGEQAMDTRLQDNLRGVQHNYVAPFLWLHGEDDELIIKEIDRIYDSGIRSVCLESRTHEDFAKSGWWDDIKLIFEECKKRNMNVWILDDKHFPSGYANGIFEEKYKELQPWGITECHLDVVGPVTEGATMADCWLEEEGDEIIAVVAAKHIPNSEKYSEIVDVTDGLNGDMVYFTLSEGMWRIIFIIKTRCGYSERFRVFSDKLNPIATEKFIEEVYQPHYERFSEYFGNTFLGFFSDEPSFRNDTADGRFDIHMGEAFRHYPWGDTAKEKMKELYKDDWRTALAGLWFDIDGISDEARYNYMDIVSDEYRNNFCNKLADWCHGHGVEYIGHIIEDNNCHCETKNGAGHYFRSLDGQDMSGIDVVLHQIVPGLTECSSAGYVSYKHMNNDFFHYYIGKLGSSFAHIDEKKKGRAMCEIFGAYGWAEGTKIMKYLIDHMLVRGINYFVPHAFSPKPNDTDCPPNFYDTGKNPQHKFFKKNMDYMNRMSYMLNDGKHIPTCAILYDAESRWINKDFLPLEKIAKELYDNLYDYDIIPVDYLDKIENGALNGEKYNLLIVPCSESIPNYVLNKLKTTDIKVITVSEKGYDSVFENITLDSLVDYMQDNKYCEVQSDYKGIFLRYYHYTRDDAHIYMFSNEGINDTINTKVRLSAFDSGKYIEYDAFENTACIKESDGEIEINLSPYHSIMLIFGDVLLDGIAEYEEYNIKSEKILTPEFTISVAERNAEEYKLYKVTDKLCNITGAKELPHFSGHIKYEAEFEMEDDGKYMLDLGYVGEVAELYINDKFVGEKLFPPYRFDISEFVVKGKNKMTVIVSNHNGYAVRDKFSKYLLFEPSGLLGAVKMIKYATLERMEEYNNLYGLQCTNDGCAYI